MHNIWKDIGIFELSEHTFGGQVLMIGKNGWLSELEIEEIKRKITLGEDKTERCAVSETDERSGVVEEERGAIGIFNTESTKEAIFQ